MPPEASLVSPHGRSLSSRPGLYTLAAGVAPGGPEAESGLRGLGFPQRGQDFGGVVRRLHTGPDGRDSAVGPH